MTLAHLIYASRPFGFDDLALTGILASARRHNARNGITGALICREDLFLQLLEGPPEAISETYARIVRDDRHTEVVKLVDAAIDARMFPAWAMRHDPARSWMWTPDEVSAGAVTAAQPEEVVAIFKRIASEPPSAPQTCPFSA